MAIKFLNDIDATGELQGTSLDINGNADISGNLTVALIKSDTFNNAANSHNIIYRSGTSTFIAGGDKLVVEDGGDVGIGIANPAQKLHIVDTDGANIILNSNTGAENSGVFMTEGAVASPYTNGAYMYYDGANNAFKINTGTTSLSTKLTIDRDTGNATFAGGVSIGGHTMNDIDVASEVTNADDHLMSALAIKNKIEDYGYLTSSSTTTQSGTKTFSGVVDITNSTEATDSTGDTGALRVEGGISSAGHVYAEGLMSQMGRSQIDHESYAYPIGHYTTGKDVFSIDPTWTEQQLQEFFNGNVTWATESDAPAGWSVLVTGGVNVGYPYGSTFPLIPIDDTSIYITECWIKNVGTDQRHYMGSAERQEDFASPSTGQGNTGSYGYHVMSNQNPGSSWTRVTGHITGRSGTASGNFETDANYFSPLALFNYGAGSGTRACLISGWRITKIDKQEYFADGTAALPSITNYNDTDTGIYWNAANELSLTTGGTNRLTINSTSATFAGSITVGTNANIDNNLTVSGGNISLGGTGRIQGIDTVSASTDAANKAYVDGAVIANTDTQDLSISGTTLSLTNSPDVTIPQRAVSTSVSSTSTTVAGTSSAVKSAYDRGSTGITNAASAQTTANAALPKAGGTMTGVLTMTQNNGIPINITGANSTYTAIAIKNTGTGNAGIYYDAINGDLSGGDYGFVGQDNDGYMSYHIGSSSPQAWHAFNAPVKVTGEIEATSLDINGNADISGNLTGVDTLTATTFSGDLNGTINTATTAATQSAGNNSTKVATTAYADAAVAALIDNAPANLNTLNELAEALNDDDDAIVTINTALGTKLPLAGGTITGNVKFNDNVEARFGAGADLKIYHDGSNSYIDDVGTGRLRFKSSTQIDFLGANGESMANMIENGAVKLYHNNVQKLETVTGGVLVAGELEATTLDINGAASILGVLSLDGNLFMSGTGHLGAADNFYIGGATAGTDHTYIGDANRNVTIFNGATFTVASGITNLNGGLDVNGNADISGDLVVAGKISQSGVIDREEWGRTYVVAGSGSPQTLLTSGGGALPNGGGYRVTGHISGTGTDNVAVAVFWNENGTWYVNNTYFGGSTSNHVNFLISGAVPKVSMMSHSGTYSIHVTHEHLSLEEGTGTDNLRGYFGADSYLSWQENGDTLTIAGTLDVNGPADISGNLSGVNTLTCTDLTIGSDATTAIGKAYLKTPNVSAVSYQRINANETLSLLNAAQMLSAIGGAPIGGSTGRFITGGLYGTGHSNSILPIWQYNAGNPGYGIGYTESSPDNLRIDVSNNLMSGTPDFQVLPNEAKVNGNTVYHTGNIPTWNQNTTGSSASCTGNAATATNSTQLNGFTLARIDHAEDFRTYTGLNASAAQAKRYHVGRLYGCPAHWDGNWQNIEINVTAESYESANLRFAIMGDYTGANNQASMLKLYLKEASGPYCNHFRFVMGTPVDAGWNHSNQDTYYVDLYAEVKSYGQFKMNVKSYGHGIQSANPTSGGATTVFYDSPTVSNISAFTEEHNTIHHLTSEIYHEGHKPTLSELGAQAAGTYSTATGVANNADVTPSWVPSSDPSYLTASSTQSKYLRSDAHDTTNSTVTSTNGLGFKVDSSSSARIEIESGGTSWAYLRLRDDSTVSWDLGSENGGDFEIRPGGSGTNGYHFNSSGVFTSGDGFTSTKGNTAYGWGDHGLSAQDKTDIGNLSGTNTGDQTTVSGSSGSCTGNAATVTINSTFNGTYPLLVEVTASGVIYNNPNITYNGTSNTLTSPNFSGNLTGNVTGNTSGSSGSCTGNAATATKATKIEAGGGGPSQENLNTIADSVSTGQLEYRGFNNSTSNGPATSDNANGVITVGQHSSNYSAQLAFSSNGNMYWRDNPNGVHGGWRKMWDDGNDGATSGLSAQTAAACTGNAATATNVAYTGLTGTVPTWNQNTTGTATNANNVKTTSVSNSATYFGVFVDANGTAYQDLHVGAGLQYNPEANTLTTGKLTTDTASIVENAKSNAALMTLTGAGAGNEANITLKLAGTVHGSPVKMKMIAENGDGTGVGNGIISYHPNEDTLGIGQTTTHNSMAILIDNSDVVSMKNQTTFTNGIYVSSAVQSTSQTTGTVKIAGGVGIVKTLNVGGDVVAYASSDERYKDNLKPITNPIDKVKSLTGYTFTWNDNHEQFNGNDDIGVVAQEVEKVLPEIVDTRDNGYKAVKYEKMVALLIEAVKEQQKQIDELKTMCNGCSK